MIILRIGFFLVLLCIELLSSSYAATDSNTYVVHMDMSKIKSLDNLTLKSPEKLYKQLIESISIATAAEDKANLDHISPNAQLLYVYDNIISGFSAKLSTKHLTSLKKVDGFLSATRDELLQLHTTHSPRFLGLREKMGLWSSKNLAQDVIIGIIDTGIWPEHPSFSGTGLPPVPSRWKGKCQRGPKFPASKCNRKLIGAGAFYKAYEAIAGRINETLDYRSPRDSQGHGTHTASTAGGNLVKGADFLGLAKGKAAGMRYTARLAAYKACYTLGCTSSDVLAAMEKALSDGVDILSLSLGGAPKPYYLDNIAIGAFGAVRRGVSVILSAGNGGPFGGTVSNAAPWMMTVGASYTDRRFFTRVRLGDGRVSTGSSLYTGKPTRMLPLVYGESREAQLCITSSLSRKQVEGKIVICDRGGNGRVAKGEVVKSAGGAGMILANNQIQGEELFADPHILPATSLGASASNAVKNYTSSSAFPPTASIEFLGDVYENRAPVMAAFSSRGPSLIGPDIVKPDVTGPGVDILAAWPENLSPTELDSDKRHVLFNIISGTSMSCPHVSGIIGLLKSMHVGWSPAALKSALMTTAGTRDSRNGPILDAAFNGSGFATPFDFGSGHVDPERASDPGLVYDISTEDYLDYLCSLNYTSAQIRVFAGGAFACSNKPPSDLNYPSFAVNLSKKGGNFTVTYMRTVTNVGGKESHYSVRVVEPDGVLVVVQPKVLEFSELGEKLSYSVSFMAQRGEGIINVVSTTNFSFGSLEWVFGRYSVRSPIAVTWL